MTHPVAAVVCGGVGLASGLLVPGLVGRVPPVEVDAPTDGQPERTERVDVAALVGRRSLRPLAVVVGGVVSAVLGLSLGWTWPLLYLLASVPLAIALSVVDWHTRILPSRLVFPAYAVVGVGVAASWLLSERPGGLAPLVRALLGAAVVFGLFYLAWFCFPRGMGFGDVRLAGVIALALAYLGWRELVVGVYAGFLLGGVVGGLLTLARVVERKGYPFGPFLLVGALVGVVLGPAVLDLFSS